MCLCTRRVHRMFHLVVVAVALRTYTQTHIRWWCTLVNVIVSKICAYFFSFHILEYIQHGNACVYAARTRPYSIHDFVCTYFQSKYNENNIIAILYTFTYGPTAAAAASSRQQSNVADNEKCRLSVFFAIGEEKSCFGKPKPASENTSKKLL